jgi:hypothetical protein
MECFACRHTDFLLIIIKQLLVRRADLKVVLMSATLQASLFTAYLGDCPAVHVPGRSEPSFVMMLMMLMMMMMMMQC